MADPLPTMRDYVLFETDQLLPAAWQGFTRTGPVRAFNPALLPDGDGFIFAYRVVGPDGFRRIALCRLDEDLEVVADSPIELTDFIRFQADREYEGPAKTWFADPRLYRLNSRIFIYWNSGWHEPRNYQFIQELDAKLLRPIGQPRELLLRGPRQKLEKNWTLFGDGPFYAVYSVAPHRVLRFSIEGTGDIEFYDEAVEHWDAEAYVRGHGPLRGGAPPLLIDGHYWSICHTVNGTDGNYRYAPAAYRFQTAHPFTPNAVPTKPLAFGGERDLSRHFPKLNPAVGEVIYPCGAAYRDGRWLISHGVNDERCAIAVVSHVHVAACVRPLGRTG